MADGDEQVTVAVLKSELSHQREFFEMQFGHLGEQLGEHCKVADARHADHEQRLRVVEGRTTWSRVIEGGLGLFSMLLAWMGIQRP